MSVGTSAQRLEKVAVVIPTRDRWPLLQVAIDCALHQQDVAVQVMVVDDGSVDSTPRELAAPGRFSDVSAAGEANDRAALQVARHDQPRGVSAARNLGLAHVNT